MMGNKLTIMNNRIYRNFGVSMLLVTILFSSCIVQSPKYTTFDKVLELKLGMSKEEVEKILTLAPYELKSTTDTSNSYIYIYRVNERKTLSFNTKERNGKETLGKYVQLAVTFSKKDKVTSIETCTTCADSLVTNTRIDIEKIAAFITGTIPAILVYFGLKNE